MQSQTLARVVGTWANENPAAAQDWLAQFPPGETRDRSVAAFLNRDSSWTNHVETQVAEFDAWFDLIEDPWQRSQAARRAYWRRRQVDPQAARDWLTSVKNVDPTVIRMTLVFDQD
jgi:hypothetical protein